MVPIANPRRRSWTTALALSCWILAGSAGRAEPEKKPANVALPADLALVPRSALVMLSVRPADVLAGDLDRALRGIDKSRYSLPETVQAISTAWTGGVPLSRVERITALLLPAAEPLEGLMWFVTSAAPLDRARVLKQFGNHATETKLRGMSYYRSPDKVSIVFIDRRTLLVGIGPALEKWWKGEPAAGGKGFLAEAVREAAAKRHLVLAVNGTLLKGLGQPVPLPDGLKALRPLFGAESYLMTWQFGKEFRLGLQATFAGPGPARQAEQAVRAGRDLLLNDLEELGEVQALGFVPVGGPRQAKEVIAFFEAAAPGLKALRVRRQGPTVRADLRAPGRGALWSMLMLCSPRLVNTYSSEPRYTPP